MGLGPTIEADKSLPQACVIILPRFLCVRWFTFRLNDASMLADSFQRFRDERNGAFIASVECRGYAWELLRQCGAAVVTDNCDVFIFRTSNPVVERWAKRFNAERCDMRGHRSRYMFTQERSGEWFALARAYYARELGRITIS